MTGARRPPIYVFEGFELDAQHRVLSRVGGEPIAVTARVLDLLLFFVEHPAELLSKRRLLEAIWPNTVVEENNLNQAISHLRQVLGEKAGEHRFIVNQPGRGYRFVASVTTVSPDPTEHAGQPGAVETVRGQGRQPMADVETVATQIQPENAKAPVSYRRRRFGLAMFAVTAFAIVFLVIDHYAVTPADGTAAVDPATQGRDRRAPRILALTFDGGMKDAPRLSPDGEMVAFTWDGPKGDNADVYVKVIGRDTEPIRITDHPAPERDPVWSPDGKQLAFLRIESDRTSVWSTPALGGRETKIRDVDSPPFHSGLFVGAMTWSPDGRFLVYGEKTSAQAAPRIVQVELATGKESELTPPLAGTNLWGDFGPSFSPDGRVAFVRGGSVYSNLDIWIMDADGQRARQIARGDWRTVLGLGWTSDGRELLFTAGGTGQRAYSMRPEEGIPYPLPGLGQDDRGASAAGNRLVFAKFATRQLEIWRAPGRLTVDSEPASQRLFQGSKAVSSPRGDRIAFQAALTGRAQVWIADTDGTDARALIEHETPAFDPQWSPDASHIAYWSAEAGSADIYLVELESGRVRRVTTDEANEQRPTFSRNGRWIYFSSDRSGVYEIYKMPTEGGEAVRVTHDGGFLAYESHDERYLYYQKNTGVRRFPYYETDASIVRIPTNGQGEATEILAAHLPSEGGGWVLAEGGIYYLLHEEEEPGFTIHYRDFSRLTDHVVFRGTGEAFYPTVSPDEKTLFFSRWPAPESELWLVEDFR